MITAEWTINWWWAKNFFMIWWGDYYNSCRLPLPALNFRLLLLCLILVKESETLLSRGRCLFIGETRNCLCNPQVGWFAGISCWHSVSVRWWIQSSGVNLFTISGNRIKRGRPLPLGLSELVKWRLLLLLRHLLFSWTKIAEKNTKMQLGQRVVCKYLHS